MIDKNPWIGLNPYQEGQKLYGRDDETKRFIRMLLSEHVVVLCGQSGVGKTSFIRACVCPAVRERGILPVLIRLFLNDYKYSHISQIKQYIYETLEKSQEELFINELYPLKEGEIESFRSFFERNRIVDSNGKSVKPLIILDQFEELFYMNYNLPIFKQIDEGISYEYKDELGKKYIPFYLLISIREDFISFFDRFFIIKELRINRFYLDDLNEEQAYKVITMDGKVNIDKKTAILIIQNITGRCDFSLDGIPEISVSTCMLSLYMYRLYDKSLSHNQGVISEELVKSFDAINLFTDLYNEATEKLSPMAVEYLEDMLLTSDHHRDSISEANVFIEGYVKKEELEILLNYNIIRRISYFNNIWIELSSDAFCPIIERHISERDYQRHILFDQHEPVTKISFAKRFVESFFHLKNYNEERNPLDKYVPKKGDDYEIFISYRREDGRDHARNIQQALKARNYKRIFFDYDSIQNGEFSKRIIDAIYSCVDFILVLSPKSMKRCTKKGDPVASEIRTAKKYGKHIIPVTIDGKEVKWPRSFPDDLQFIKGLQFHDHKSDSYFEHSIDELCEKLTCKKSDDKI